MSTSIFVGVVLAMQILDAWTTWQIFRLKNGYEKNPVVKAIMERVGLFWGLVIAKGTVIVAVAVAHHYGVWNGSTGNILLVAVAVFYAWILAGNLRVLYGR